MIEIKLYRQALNCYVYLAINIRRAEKKIEKKTKKRNRILKKESLNGQISGK